MKKVFIALVLSVAAFLVVASVHDCLAQTAKFAFVDFQKFAAKSKRAQNQQQKFAQMVDGKRVALENKKKEMDTLNEQLQKQGPMLKEETRNEKIKQLGIKEMELKLAEKEAQNSLQNEQREQQEIFRRDITKIINQIRAQKSYTLIFDSAALLSADDSLDITDEVVQLYDASDDDAKTGAAKPKPAAPSAAPTQTPAKPKAPASTK
ncbi:MAG: outer membrane protein [Thermodesulfobacteriota bacterium]|nr:outer membrane protein [Thermodesulfobacteriota bacterium]